MSNANNIFSFSKTGIASAVAVLFHLIGLIGILFFDRQYFTSLSAMNLLLMFVLIIITQKQFNFRFVIFILICIAVGMIAEIIGVNTGLLFGDYQYGDVLGPKLMGVPLMIGINWFVLVYCSGISIHTLINKMIRTADMEIVASGGLIKTLSIIIDGALLAVFFDWIMEPVAVKLGFWHWAGAGHIPFYNYVCWFMISMLLLLIFRWMPFEKTNKFAVHLLLIQMMFFLILRTLL